MGNFDGIIFDMDGVIFDTEKIGLESWKIVGEKYNLKDVKSAAVKCIGRSTTDSMKILDDIYGEQVDIRKLHPEVKEVFHRLIEENGLPLKSGARDILQWLSENSIPVGLASSTDHDTVVRQLRSAELLNYFKIIVGGNMVKHSKPEPEIYLLACEKLGVNPCNTFAVEDSYNGIKSAYRAGMRGILIPDLIEPDKQMLEFSEKKFDDLKQFKDWLEK